MRNCNLEAEEHDLPFRRVWLEDLIKKRLSQGSKERDLSLFSEKAIQKRTTMLKRIMKIAIENMYKVFTVKNVNPIEAKKSIITI
jgi:hypothetical protein